MKRVGVLVLALAPACSFGAPAGNNGGDSAPDSMTPDSETPIDAVDVDSPPDAVDEDVRHLDDTMLFGSGADLHFNGAVLVDTTQLTVTAGTLPTDVHLFALPQQGGGPELAVLEVKNLNIDHAFTVVGGRPLVIVAHGNVDIDAGVDASSQGFTPGPGAQTMGAGTVGMHAGGYADGGGGGGSFGTAGGLGGSANESGTIGSGGAAGAVYGNPALDTLQGGSPGGVGAPDDPNCTMGAAPGGGGGGAIQISATGKIHLKMNGAIVASGGGGSGGRGCPFNVGTAGGGGSGGAIYLQARMLMIDGILAANGGGGGGGGNWDEPGASDHTTVGMQGTPGGGAPSPSPGGAAIAPDGGAGGAGGVNQRMGAMTTTTVSTSGANVTSVFPNGGGGGGGAGYIVLDGL